MEASCAWMYVQGLKQVQAMGRKRVPWNDVTK